MGSRNQEPYQHKTQARRRNQVRDELPAAVAMDFSPPRSRSGSPMRPKPRLTSQERTQQDNIPLQQELQAMQRGPGQGIRQRGGGKRLRRGDSQQQPTFRQQESDRGALTQDFPCHRKHRKAIVPKNKTAARFLYGNGQRGRLPTTKISKRFSRVQSKIKDQVAYFRHLARDQGNR